MTVCGLSASSSVPCAFVWPSISSARSEASLQDSSLRAKSNQFRLVCERVRPLECLPKLFNYGCIMPHVCKKYLIPIDQQASDARDARRATGACGMPKYWRRFNDDEFNRNAYGPCNRTDSLDCPALVHWFFCTVLKIRPGMSCFAHAWRARGPKVVSSPASSH